jgi:hypothetical protein
VFFKSDDLSYDNSNKKNKLFPQDILATFLEIPISVANNAPKAQCYNLEKLF